MRFLLTGATGFIGARVLRAAVARGLEVAILVLPSDDPWRIEALLPQVRVMEGDLTRPESYAPTLCAWKPDTVLHLGWMGVRTGHKDDPLQLRNVAATTDLCAVAHEAGCRAFVGLGSLFEYGKVDHPISEAHPADPATLYGAAKLASAVLSRQLCALCGMRWVWLRLFSTYGPGDDANRLFPHVILTLLRGGRPSLTAGSQRWDYLYVDDVADAVLEAATDDTIQGILNLGSGTTVPVRDVVEAIRDLVAPGAPLGFGERPQRPDESLLLQADISRLLRCSRWQPQIDLQTGLHRTVTWYRANLNRYLAT